MKTVILFAVSILCLLSSTFANDFDIKSFHVDITIQDDGTFQVEETIDVFFNEKRRGLFRLIPYKYLVNGENYNIKISDIKVEGEETKISNEGRNKKIRIGHPDKKIQGHKTYYINYKVDKALVQHEDAFEFYWNLTGNDWDIPIEVASFNIRYPDQVELSKQDIRIFADDYGSEFTAVEYEITRNELKGKSTRLIDPGNGISVATMIPANQLSIAPSSLRQIEIPKVYPKDIYFPIPAMILGWFLWLWKTKDRREIPDKVDEKYYPPNDMSPTEVGAFYDYQVNNRDILALIPKWGNEGLIKLESIPKADEEYDIYFHKEASISLSAPAYEQELFNGLFDSSKVIFLEDLKNKFYKTFSQSKANFSKDIILQELYDQESKNKLHNPWSTILWIGLILLGGFMLINFHLWISGGILIVFAIAGFIITFSRPKLSERGYNAHMHLKGLKNFLSNPHPTKIHQLISDDPNYLDKIFPYVVAFGLDDKWNSKLKTIDGVSHHPAWYYESGNRHSNNTIGSFTKAFSPKSIESAFTSSPHSSSGSGGGGGVSGSSGGGFGGGGGGSW